MISLFRAFAVVLFALSIGACAKKSSSRSTATPTPPPPAGGNANGKLKAGDLDSNGTTVPAIDGDWAVFTNPRYRNLYLYAGNLIYNRTYELNLYADYACRFLGYKQAMDYRMDRYFSVTPRADQAWEVSLRNDAPVVKQVRLPGLGQNDAVYVSLKCRK